jgi:hypothetical protein
MTSSDGIYVCEGCPYGSIFYTTKRGRIKRLYFCTLGRNRDNTKPKHCDSGVVDNEVRKADPK